MLRQLRNERRERAQSEAARQTPARFKDDGSSRPDDSNNSASDEHSSDEDSSSGSRANAGQPDAPGSEDERSHDTSLEPAASAGASGATNAGTTNAGAGTRSDPAANASSPATTGSPSATATSAGDPVVVAIDPEGFGAPLAGLSADELARFKAGADQFLEEETPEKGVGPLFNEISCVACHSVPTPGGASERLETRFGRIRNGVFDPLTELGGSLLQDHAIGTVRSCGGAPTFFAESVPRQSSIIAQRRTPPLFGLGLVEAVPDSTFRTLRDQESLHTPASAGVLSEVKEIVSGNTVVGKFGWKGQNPTLFQFAADALLSELGVTSAQFPAENCPQGDCLRLMCNPAKTNPNDDGSAVRELADFMTFLAPPPRGAVDDRAKAGEQEFANVGCADCHTPTLTTGINVSRALDHVTFHPYSDFLLHDMGPLGDGIEQAGNGGRLMRTAPLWGLRKITTFLHDGRASSVVAAVEAHDGQGVSARERFFGLPQARRDALLAFLSTL